MTIFAEVAENEFLRERYSPVQIDNFINTARYLANGAR